MTSSMADHLRSQDYLRQRRSTASLLVEPRISDESAARLVEAFERNETSAEEYLSLVTSERQFTPRTTTHVVVIETGTYCSTSPVPVILKSFLHDNRNAVVGELLKRREVAVVEKIPSGDILIRVQTSDAENKLAGQEVMLLGRKFKNKKQSPFLNKFYLDVSGICTSEIANAIFLGLSDVGARPMFFTPRDVNLEAQVATPTWRFYFGKEAAPQCLMVHGFVTNQLTLDGKFYVARGKRSTAPPERASGYRKFRYSVQLPSATQMEAYRHHSGSSSPSDTNRALESDALSEQASSSQENASPHPAVIPPMIGLRNATEDALHDSPERAGVPTASRSRERTWTTVHSEHVDNPGTSSRSLGNMHHDWSQEDLPVEMDVDLSKDEDVDMLRNIESGFKRCVPSFVDENPYEALSSLVDCTFDTSEPEVASDKIPGVLIVPSLKINKTAGVQAEMELLPTKKRATILPENSQVSTLENEAIFTSEEKTRLETREDRVEQNLQHLDQVTSLLTQSKNMDVVVQSIRTFPLAWSIAYCNDLVHGGKNLKELAEIHVWNRVLAACCEVDTGVSFHQRVLSLHLKLGKTREDYLHFLRSSLAHQAGSVKTQWALLRCLSAFELLSMSVCPFIFTTRQWLLCLTGDNDKGLPHSHVRLLSDASLLRLLRSGLGQKVMSEFMGKAPTSEVLSSINAVRTCSLSIEGLPKLSTSILTTVVREPDHVCIGEADADN